MNNMKLYDSGALREVAVIIFLSISPPVLLMTSSVTPATGQNYDESQVPRYELPDPLIFSNGKDVDSPAAWWEQRRGEILQLFEDQVYGRSPEKLPKVRLRLPKRGEGHWTVWPTANRLRSVLAMEKAARSQPPYLRSAQLQRSCAAVCWFEFHGESDNTSRSGNSDNH